MDVAIPRVEAKIQEKIQNIKLLANKIRLYGKYYINSSYNHRKHSWVTMSKKLMKNGKKNY